jgi:hypothetical protein
MITSARLVPEEEDCPMERGSRLERACDFYIRRVAIIGALYCIVPTLAWFVVTLGLIPFRSVYLLRVALSVVFGGSVAAYVNHYGITMWLIKHRSQRGPATVGDGALIGGAVGIGTALLPALTNLIGTNSPEDVKTYIIVTWLCAMVLGAIIGGILASVGRKHIDSSG